ncbi:hypothetical protein [Sporomusa aerivorans]
MFKVNTMAAHILSLIRLFAFSPGETLMVLSQVKQAIKSEEKAKEA